MSKDLDLQKTLSFCFTFSDFLSYHFNRAIVLERISDLRMETLKRHVGAEFSFEHCVPLDV